MKSSNIKDDNPRYSNGKKEIHDKRCMKNRTSTSIEHQDQKQDSHQHQYQDHY